MKRLTGLFSALILGCTLTTTTLMPRDASAVSALLTGTPESIEFYGGDQIQDVFIMIKRGWLNSDAFELDISITGTNDHGQKTVALSSATLLDNERDLAVVSIPWDDPYVQLVGEIYEVCVQVLVSGEPLGELACDRFGPF